MQKLILFFVIFVFNLCFSQTYFLNVNLRDGTNVKYYIKDIKKIDFSNITSLNDSKKIKKIVNSFKLMQNFPNPFNPSTKIQYEIPRTGNVIISIYDISGRLIKNIVISQIKVKFFKI